MNRIIIILILLLLFVAGYSQEEKCSSCVKYDPTTHSQLLSDVYPEFADSKLKDARITILPADLLVLADTVEVTQKMLDNYMKKKFAGSDEAFKQLEMLTIKMLVLKDAEKWAVDNKIKMNGDNLIIYYYQSLTSQINISDAEVKSYYNVHKTEYKGKKISVVDGQIKQSLLKQKKDAFLEQYRLNLIKSTYTEINQSWLQKIIK